MFSAFGFAGCAINLVVGAILIFVQQRRQGRSWLVYASVAHFAVSIFYLLTLMKPASVHLSEYMHSRSSTPALMMTIFVACWHPPIILALFGRRFSRPGLLAVTLLAMMMIAAVSLLKSPITGFQIAQLSLILANFSCGYWMLRGPTAFYRLVGISFCGRGSYLALALFVITTDAHPAMLEQALILNLIFICMTGLGMVLIELDDARALAAEANASKSMFIANMSHELRTPLNAIIGFSEIMEIKSAELPADRRREYATYVLTAGRHLLSIINQLLDMASIEAGNGALERHRVDLDAVIRDCFKMLSGEAAAKGIVLKFIKPDAEVTIESNECAARQIILCLISNAVKFSRTGAAVTVQLAQVTDKRDINVSVSDEGPGIASENLKKIFQPFWQAGATYQREHGGLGLGLAIAQNLARKIGANISVVSQLGRGAIFTVNFRTG